MLSVGLCLQGMNKCQEVTSAFVILKQFKRSSITLTLLRRVWRDVTLCGLLLEKTALYFLVC